MTPNERIRPFSLRRFFRTAILCTSVFFILIMLRTVVFDALSIVFGAAVVAFLVQPLTGFYERKLCRTLAALGALATFLGILILALWLLLPSLAREISELTEALPYSIEMVRRWLDNVSAWLSAHLPGIRLPSPSLPSEKLPALARGTITFAGSIADIFYRMSLMIVLGYFFLCDREKILIRLELLFPRSIRRTAVQMGNAVSRELKLYLRGQGMIAAAVGMLSAMGLALAGVRSALVLGIIVGVLNMIPYFGPVIGAVPAVLTALTDGWSTVAAAVAVLWLVQQADSSLISPRIMSSLTGVSPATVLLAIFIGSGLGGIVGMLLAMPVVMAFRTVFRVFVQRYENV